MLQNKSVLVTGGTGTFGTAFCRHVIANYQPKKVAVLSRDWVKQDILRGLIGDPECLRLFIGDVRDPDRLRRAFAGVDYVIHAAAMKDIVSSEYNPREALLTNAVGTQNVIDAAIDCNVGKVVFLSSDKATSASNNYGRTKALAENLIVQGNAYAGSHRTRFSAVRYGNVIGSRGSVVEIFSRQRASGVLTITDPRMTRFWITVQQAVDLVLYTLERMAGGEIFVPKIPSMRVSDLARGMAPECEIQEVGIRPGEKLHETLISSDESRHAYEREDCYVIWPERCSWAMGQPTGKPLTDGWEYRSDTNTEWLEPERMLEMSA